MKQCVAIDFGFGWTKVATHNKTFRIPSWIGLTDERSGEITGKVSYNGKEYAIGEDVKFLSKKININDINDLITYYPVFISGILKRLNIEPKDAHIVTGIPPAYKDLITQIEQVFETIGVSGFVTSQSTGIFIDVIELIKGDIVLVLDIGFNTFDFLVVSREDGDWRKVRSGSMIGQGVNKTIELFKENIENIKIKNKPTNALIKAFEEGRILIDGSFENVSLIRKKAIESYVEIIRGRLFNELGDDLMDSIEEVVIGGGGANFIEPSVLGFKNAFKPNEPEFSQVRGYLKMAGECNEEK